MSIFRDGSIHVGFSHYNSDNYLKITLSDYSNLNVLEFAVSISVFKNDLKHVNASCTISKPYYDDSNLVIWEHSYGYSNNAKCSYTLIIEPETEVRLHALILLENHVDVITFYDSDGFENVSSVLSTKVTDMRFFPNDDGSQKQIIFEFTSDANIQTGYFKLTFERIGSLLFICFRVLT